MGVGLRPVPRAPGPAVRAGGGGSARELVPGAVEGFRFSDLRVYPFADPNGAVAEVRAEGLITATGRTYRQEYVLFLRAEGGKIAYLREYFDPVRAARALDTPIADGR